MSIDDETLAKYDACRRTADRRNVCNAPFSNIYFAIDGRAAPCWLTFHRALRWPGHSIHEIWTGAHFEGIRDGIRSRDLSAHQGCTVCANSIRSGNYAGTLAAAYDLAVPVGEYPSIMELELSNVCNLECIMCRGELSSSIRRNRDQLPPLPIPYDTRFVEQLTEFLPHLAEIRVNGGEPLLHEIFYEVCEKIAEINPDIEITIATNGTVLNQRVRETLQRCRIRINVSIDALDRRNFERIRKNARYDVVMRNVAYFGEYCRRRGTTFSVMINPMRQTWWEMPDLVEWCNSHSYHLAFNTVVKPAECSLITWDATHLREVYETLRAAQFETPEDDDAGHVQRGNVVKYENFVENQIRPWLAAQVSGRTFLPGYYSD